MSDVLYSDLPVSVVRRGDYVQVGVMLHGEFFPFAGFKGPDFDQRVSDAQTAESERTNGNQGG